MVLIRYSTFISKIINQHRQASKTEYIIINNELQIMFDKYIKIDEEKEKRMIIISPPPLTSRIERKNGFSTSVGNCECLFMIVFTASSLRQMYAAYI